MGLNNINSKSTWGQAASDINTNFTTIDSDLKKVKNATTRNKGYFSSINELKAAFSTANVGDIAYVGSAYPYAIWKWNGSAWANSGSTGGEESVNLGDFYTKVETDEKFTETDEKLSELGSVSGLQIKALSVTWNQGYVNSQGVISQSTTSVYSQPILIKKGELIVIGTANTNIGAINKTELDSVGVGNTVSIIKKTQSTAGFNYYQYAPMSDEKIVLSALNSDKYVALFTIQQEGVYDSALKSQSQDVFISYNGIISYANNTITFSAGNFYVGWSDGKYQAVYLTKTLTIATDYSSYIVYDYADNTIKSISRSAYNSHRYIILFRINSSDSFTPSAYMMDYIEQHIKSLEKQMVVVDDKLQQVDVYEAMTRGGYEITEVNVKVNSPCKCKFVPKTKSWNISSVDSGASVFWIVVGDRGLFETKAGGFVGLKDSYEFNVNEGESVTVKFRGDNGELIEFELVDYGKTKFDELNERIERVEESLTTEINISTFTRGEYTITEVPIKATAPCKCRLIPKTKIWNTSSVPSGANVFWVVVGDRGLFETKVDVFDGLSDFYEFEINEGESAVVKFRGDSGETILFDYVIDLYSELNNVLVKELYSDSILTRWSKDKMVPILGNFNREARDFGQDYNASNFVLMWYSDIHAETKILERYKEFYEEYKDYITEVHCSGDLLDRWNDDFSFWEKMGMESTSFCIGNHEILAYFGKIPTIDGVKLKEPMFSKKRCYERFFSPYLDMSGITIQENQSYWYKDFTDQKIRFIALDTEHWREVVKDENDKIYDIYPDGGTTDNGDQAIWLASVLEECKILGFSAVISLHQPMRMDKWIDCTFNTLFHSSDPFPYYNEVAEIVQTYIDGGGKFVVYLGGHNHQDEFGYVQGFPNQVCMTIDTSRVDLRNGEIFKAHGTNSEDCFEIVCVNTTFNLITFYRIGSNYDRHGRRIESLIYDYVKHEVVYNL